MINIIRPPPVPTVADKFGSPSLIIPGSCGSGVGGFAGCFTPADNNVPFFQEQFLHMRDVIVTDALHPFSPSTPGTQGDPLGACSSLNEFKDPSQQVKAIDYCNLHANWGHCGGGGTYTWAEFAAYCPVTCNQCPRQAGSVTKEVVVTYSMEATAPRTDPLQRMKNWEAQYEENAPAGSLPLSYTFAAKVSGNPKTTNAIKFLRGEVRRLLGQDYQMVLLTKSSKNEVLGESIKAPVCGLETRSNELPDGSLRKGLWEEMQGGRGTAG